MYFVRTCSSGVKSDIVEVCPWARSSSSRSLGSAPAAAWTGGDPTPAWTTQERLDRNVTKSNLTLYTPFNVNLLFFPLQKHMENFK